MGDLSKLKYKYNLYKMENITFYNLNKVEEILLKQRKEGKREIDIKEKKKIEKKKLKKVLKKKFLFKKPQSILKRFKITHTQNKRILNRLKQKYKFKFSSSMKMVFVIRIRYGKTCPKLIKNSLIALGLRNFLDACFLRLNEPNKTLLVICKTWLTFGYPTNQMIQQLLTRRGCIGPERIPIENNKIVENFFGSLGLICISDVLDVLERCTDQFDKVVKTLGVLMLGKPEQDFSQLRKQFSYGFFCNEAKKINDFIKEIL